MAQALDTAEDFLERVRERVMDKDKDKYPDSELLGYLNSVQRLIMKKITRLWPSYKLAKASLYEKSWDIVADTAKYDLPSDFFETVHNGIRIEGDPQPFLTFNEYQNGNKSGVFLLSNQIAISPVPDENSTDGLKLYYVKRPDVVSAITDSVEYGTEFPDTIIELVAMYAKARNNDSAEFQAQVASRAEKLMRGHVVATNKPENHTIGLDVTTDWY